MKLFSKQLDISNPLDAIEGDINNLEDLAKTTVVNAREELSQIRSRSTKLAGALSSAAFAMNTIKVS